MGTDTECNLAIEARGDPAIKKAASGLRERLLAEHLDHSPAEVADALRRTKSLHQAIAELNQEGKRGLKAIEPELDPKLDALVPDQQVLDPERPIDPDTLVEDLVPHEEARGSVRTRLILLAIVVVALIAVALAWRLHAAAGVARARAADRARQRAAREPARARCTPFSSSSPPDS
jgi:hypothetical protein